MQNYIYKSSRKSKILLNQAVSFKSDPSSRIAKSKPFYVVASLGVALALVFVVTVSKEAQSNRVSNEKVLVNSEIAFIDKAIEEEMLSSVEGDEFKPVNNEIKETETHVETVLEESLGKVELIAAAATQAKIVKVGLNDSFYTIMYEIGLKSDAINYILSKSKEHYNFSKIKENDRFNVVKSNGIIKSVDYKISDLESLQVLFDDGNSQMPQVTYNKAPYVVENFLAQGEIETTFYEAGLEAGLDATAIMNLTDIFAWDVDFATEIQKGDRFSVLIEAYYLDGLRVGSGKILAASFENSGSTYNAVYYKDEQGKGAYYDLQGNTIRRTLLKSPLRYRRISSSFSRKRFHPILKKYKAHHGVDYAAPKGSAIEASGDGKVVKIGWNGGYGNYIKIRHNGVYTTAYGHLSKFRKGLRKGSKVKQGQVIGYVGSTGRSTGPHLHYEVHLRGKMVNPLSIKNSPKSKVNEDAFDDYLIFADKVRNVFDSKESKLASQEFPSYWVF